MLSTQKYNVVPLAIRLNASALFMSRLKNFNEASSFLDVNSALVDAKTALCEMYQQAIGDALYSPSCI